MTPRRLAGALLVTLALAPAAGEPGLRAQERVRESVPLTLYQLMARAPIVLHGRITHGAIRLAEVKVLENFRGKAPADDIRLDFRDLNIQTAGKDQVSFADGDEYIFFLARPNFRKQTKKKEDILELYHGRDGFRRLPPEGAGEVIEAVRQLASVMDQPAGEQAAALRQRAQQRNALLQTTALDELMRLQEGDRDDLDWLQRLVRDPDPGVRGRAAALMSRVFQTLPAASAEQERPSLESIRERAHGDPDATVRIASVKALGSWPERDQVVPDLQAIGASDASQDVRYEARRLLYLWGR
ncbi:MAG TPA: hypothetical protein VGS03_06065 [Candidatus Polarisedimenticolia bacterium]|jgi:HEAT repeat protein|nr:hypothetical protein [Candidatus Polarisedimenticolia bacterium]